MSLGKRVTETKSPVLAPIPGIEKARSLALAFVLLTGITLPGCTNNFLKGTSQSLEEGSLLPPVNSPTGSGLVLSRVVKSAQDSSTFDLVGDGSGAIGQTCVPNQNENAGASSDQSDGPTTCKCYFTWTNLDGSVEQNDVDTLYRESNLIRCRYTGAFPDNTSYVKVAIRTVGSDELSNLIGVKLSGGSLDLGDAASFAKVQRYQCRDIVSIMNILDRSVYDPNLSEDPRISFPMNFFTINMGGALAEYAAKGITDWDCPGLPNDSSKKLDLTLYSRGPDSSGSIKIFPPDGSSFDRSTFYLAREKSGYFNVPVNAYSAPMITTGGDKPLGYGVTPIPTSSGETCPDTSVPIPAGFQWVKVWQFRVQLPARKYKTTHKIGPYTGALGAVSCNPGNWSPTPVPFSADCAGYPALSNDGSLAARILTFYGGDKNAQMCVRFDGINAPCNWHSPGCTTKDEFSQWDPANNKAYDNYPLGSDVWEPVGDSEYACNRSKTVDPLNVCLGLKVPHDPGPLPDAYADPTTDPNKVRFDFMFVVTPPTVMFKQMSEGGNLSTNLPYIPYRFRSKEDCVSGDPLQPATPGDCSTAGRIDYELFKNDVNTNGDAPGTNPERLGSFPVCALQPKK